MRQVGNEVLDDPHVVQRKHRRALARIGYESRARQPVRAVGIHGTGAADAFAARTAKGEGRIDFVLDPDQNVQNHRSAVVEIDIVESRRGFAPESGL
jgi:hypothetical protein